MPSLSSCFRVLGIELPCAIADIRTAFRRRALEVHPDKGGSSAAFREVALAYETLVTNPSSCLSAPTKVRQRNKTQGGKETQATPQRPPQPTSGTAGYRPTDGSENEKGNNWKDYSTCQARRPASFPMKVPAAAANKSPPDPPVKATKAQFPNSYKTASFPTDGDAVSRNRGKQSTYQPSGPEPSIFRVSIRARPLLQLLCYHLRRVPQVKRREVVEKQMTQKMRLSLERWVKKQMRRQQEKRSCKCLSRICADVSSMDLTEDENASGTTLPAICAEAHEPGNNSKDSHQFGHTAHSLENAPESCEESHTSDDSSTSEADEDGPDDKPKARVRELPRGVLTGVTVRQARKNLGYQAMIFVYNIKLTTRTVDALATALDYHILLVDLKRRVIEAKIGHNGYTSEGRSFESVFMDCLGEILDESHVCEADLGLSACVVGSTVYWIGRDLYRYFPRNCVADSLLMWREVKDARPLIVRGGPQSLLARFCPEELEQQWQRIRNVYLKWWHKTRRMDSMGLQAASQHLDRMYRLHASNRERSVQEWNRLRMQKEEQRTRLSVQEGLRLAAQETIRMRREDNLSLRFMWAVRRQEKERLRRLRQERRTMKSEDRLSRKRRRLCDPDYWAYRQRSGCDTSVRRVDELIVLWFQHEQRQASKARRAAELAAKRKNQHEAQRKRNLRKVDIAAAVAKRAENKRLAAQRRAAWNHMRRRDITMEEMLRSRTCTN